MRGWVSDVRALSKEEGENEEEIRKRGEYTSRNTVVGALDRV